jgi:thiamine biosynthesis lipoprotein
VAGAHTERFACFGGECSVTIEGDDGAYGDARHAATWARAHLLRWHGQFSRFLPTSELSCLNADPREEVPASPLLVELAAAVRAAGELTGGLVDATLVGALEEAGYERDLPHAAAAAGTWREVGDSRPPAPAGPSVLRDWSTVRIDRGRGTIARPPGVRLDSGGLVKGLLADVLCGWLGGYDDVVVDCCGDVRFGGTMPGAREVEVAHPRGGTATTLIAGDGAVATSGTTGRQWLRADGRPAHHLIDPSTGQPARTGLIQATALAPTALEAEVLAKWALLSGAEAAALRLVHGGVVIDEAGAVHAVAPRLARAS